MNATSTSGDLDVPAIKTLLREMQLPPEIEEIEVRFADDASGDPGLYISFTVAAGTILTQKDIERLTRFTSDAAEQLLQAGLRSFPYIDLQQAS